MGPLTSPYGLERVGPVPMEATPLTVSKSCGFPGLRHVVLPSRLRVRKGHCSSFHPVQNSPMASHSKTWREKTTKKPLFNGF